MTSFEYNDIRSASLCRVSLIPKSHENEFKIYDYVSEEIIVLNFLTINFKTNDNRSRNKSQQIRIEIK